VGWGRPTLTEPTKPLVVVRDLRFHRVDPTGRRVAELSVPRFDAYPGECVVIGGPSGSGKSTVLSLLAGILPGWGGEATGSVLVADRPVGDLSPGDRAPLIGVFPQDPSESFVHETVADVCSFVPRNLGWEPDRVVRARDEALGRFGLDHLGSTSPWHLSGGEQALVVLASLWMVRPRVILFDEPLASLDGAHTAQWIDALQTLKAEGCTLILAEHRVEALAPLVDRWWGVDRGTLTPGSRPDPAAEAGGPPVGRPRPSDGEVVLEARGLGFGRGRTLGTGVSLTLRRGQILGVRGPNGVGKSTLLGTLAGLVPPREGQVHRPGTARWVGQDPWDQLCRPEVVEEAAVDLGARARRRLPPIPGEPRVTLDRARLGDDVGRSPFLLSEGAKRRLAVACGVLSGADVLLVDEPTAGLDPESARAVTGLILGFADAGGAVVCATHDEGLVAALGADTLTLVPPDPPAPGPGPLRPRAPGTWDPRVGLVAFLGTLTWALQPLPLVWASGFLAGVILSYLGGGRWKALGRFSRALALFWIVPGLVLWALVGPWEALAGLVRLSLLTLLFHRYSLTVDGHRLSIALTGWGVPYAVGFSLSAAASLVPALGQRLATMADLLVLRVTRWGRRSWAPSPRVVGALFVPALVHLWRRATRLGMALELQGFHGQPPEAPPRLSVAQGLVCIALVLGALGGAWACTLLR